jgi:pimeloyl-ACP methyl ester carboxylesterase
VGAVPHPAPRRARTLGVATVTVVLAAVLASCSLVSNGGRSSSTPTVSPSPMPTRGALGPGSGSPLASFYHQKLTWHPCRNHDQCARVRVPLDYANPGGRSISLAVLKRPADDPGNRVGSLVVNPGGPGGSGVDYATNASSYFGPNILRNYDVVGFDPRGVGESTPIHCLSTHQLDTMVASDPDPETPGQIRYSNALLRELGRGCEQHSGALLAHVSTVEAAKDIDILRAALGQTKLSYFGASYGTYLGATYAGLFPTRVGRMVLDGAIDPTLSTEQMDLAQAHGFEVALRSYVGHCVDAGNCFLGPTVDAGTRRIHALLNHLENHPLPGADGRMLTAGNGVLGVWAPLYNKNYWPILDSALKAALSGQGAPLLSLSDAYTSRGPNGYTDNSLEALYAVNCLDHPDSIPSSKVSSYVPEFEKASPTFGAIFASSLSSCSYWPVHSHKAAAPIHAKGAPPILVIGTTRDPATPLAWAQALAKQLDSGILIKRNGDGHTGYDAGNTCVDTTVESYLVSGQVPARHEVDC